MSTCRSGCLYICPLACLSVCLPVRQPACWFFCLSACLHTCPLPACLPVCMPICLPAIINNCQINTHDHLLILLQLRTIIFEKVADLKLRITRKILLRNCDCGSRSFKLRSCDCGPKKKLRMPTSANFDPRVSRKSRENFGSKKRVSLLARISKSDSRVNPMVTLCEDDIFYFL
jgi:hypothetical protein